MDTNKILKFEKKEIKKYFVKKKNIQDFLNQFDNNILLALKIGNHLSRFSDLWLDTIPENIFVKIIQNINLFPKLTIPILFNLSINHYQFIIDNNGVKYILNFIPEIPKALNTIKRIYFKNKIFLKKILTKNTISKLNFIKPQEIDIDYINKTKVLKALSKLPLNAHFFDLARFLNKKKIFIERYPLIKIETMPENFDIIFNQLESIHDLTLQCSNGICYCHSIILKSANISLSENKWKLLSVHQGNILIKLVYTRKLKMDPEMTENLLEINKIFDAKIIQDYVINYMASLIELDIYFQRFHPVWWVLELSIKYKLLLISLIG